MMFEWSLNLPACSSRDSTSGSSIINGDNEKKFTGKDDDDDDGRQLQLLD